MCVVPLNRPVASANCPPEPGWSPPPPPPRSPGGRRAAAAPWAARTTCRSAVCSAAAPDGPTPGMRQERF